MNKPECERKLLNRHSSLVVGASVPIASLNEERSPHPATAAAIDDQGETKPSFLRGVRQQMVRRWAECILAVIILSSALLTSFWVFKVPILQSPDENSHIDYAFGIYSAGRLLNVRRTPSEWNVPARVTGAPHERISHVYTLYLIDATGFQRLKYKWDEKVPSDYGTAAYYRKLDFNAPGHPANAPDLQPEDNPWLITGYPFGYYALIAVWMKLVSLFSDGPVALFFAARIFSVILLACSLFLTYAILRELRLRKARSLALTAVVGFFPMTTFLSSSVQPDTLSFTLISLCFYLTLLLRRKPVTNGLLGGLGVALGFLLLTKYHFYLFALGPILAMVASEHFFKRRPRKDLLRVFVILLLPSMLFFAIQLWVVWGGERITGGNIHFATSGYVTRLKLAVLDYFSGGSAFVSWWGWFGWMDTRLTIRSPSVQRGVLGLLKLATLVVLVLMVFRVEQVFTRLFVVARRGKVRTALRIVFANPIMNSYFLFSGFMLLLYAIHENGFDGQGRHWFPYILCSFLIATHYAPRALSHRKTQAAFSFLIILGLALYCAVGSYYAVRTINDRYYAASTSAADS